MIRGVFFDMGGVLLRTEDVTARRKWEKRFGLPDWGLADAVFNSEPSRRASLGMGGVADIWEHIAQRFGLNGDELAELQNDFWAGDKFDEQLLAYIGSLRPRFRTGLISNAWPNLREFLAQYEFVQTAFERLYISAEMGMAKPDRRIYQVALGDFGLKPEEAVFVDDQAENVEAAEVLGMAGLHYQSGLDVPAQLAALGVG